MLITGLLFGCLLTPLGPTNKTGPTPQQPPLQLPSTDERFAFAIQTQKSMEAALEQSTRTALNDLPMQAGSYLQNTN